MLPFPGQNQCCNLQISASNWLKEITIYTIREEKLSKGWVKSAMFMEKVVCVCICVCVCGSVRVCEDLSLLRCKSLEISTPVRTGYKPKLRRRDLPMSSEYVWWGTVRQWRNSSSASSQQQALLFHRNACHFPLFKKGLLYHLLLIVCAPRSFAVALAYTRSIIRTTPGLLSHPVAT
jgi:hypothetical protein